MTLIDFNKPCIVGNEQKYMAEAIGLGHISGDGKFTKNCHEYIEKLFAIPKVLLTSSCTHALEMAAILLDIKEGDEVILPSFTFVSTVNAFVLRGAKPVFIDIRKDTLNLDEESLTEKITPRTKAIVAMHYAGIACEMEKIQGIADSHKIPIVEDNAHGLFGKYHGRYLGTFGKIATQSFHETKNFTCGEGGAVLLNDPELIERAEIIREKGTNRSRFFRGQVDKYSWVDIGSSYLPSELLAAFLFAQLEKWEAIQEKRKSIWDFYTNNLQDWAGEQQVQLPTVPEGCEPAYHLFYMLMPSLKIRTDFINYLRANEICTVFHYLPLHNSDMGRKFGGKEGDCPVTEMVSDQLIRLPFHFELTQADLEKILDMIKAYRIPN